MEKNTRTSLNSLYKKIPSTFYWLWQGYMPTQITVVRVIWIICLALKSCSIIYTNAHGLNSGFPKKNWARWTNAEVGQPRGASHRICDLPKVAQIQADKNQEGLKYQSLKPSAPKIVANWFKTERVNHKKSPKSNLLVTNNILKYWSTAYRTSKKAKLILQNMNFVKLNTVSII